MTATATTAPDRGTTAAATAAPVSAATATTRTSRAWAGAGVAGGIGALATMPLTTPLAPGTELLRDNALVAGAIRDAGPYVWAYQALASATAAAVVVFALGLRRRLAEQEPAGSLLPSVAAAGLLLVAALTLAGAGISTELFWALRNPGDADPDTIAANLAIFNTLAWVWAGAGLAAGSVAVAALRHGSASRWLGWVGAGAAALIAVTQVLPIQYLALLPGGVWLLVTGLGLWREHPVQ